MSPDYHVKHVHFVLTILYVTTGANMFDAEEKEVEFEALHVY